MIRGEIWWADFGIPFGSEPGYKRPVFIIQDDDFNKSKINTIIVIPITSNLMLGDAPGNVYLEKDVSGLSKESVIVVSQLGVLDKSRMIEKIGKLNKGVIQDIEDGIKLVLGLIKIR
jgi:mRNA interferase MazF